LSSFYIAVPIGKAKIASESADVDVRRAGSGAEVGEMLSRDAKNSTRYSKPSVRATDARRFPTHSRCPLEHAGSRSKLDGRLRNHGRPPNTPCPSGRAEDAPKRRPEDGPLGRLKSICLTGLGKARPRILQRSGLLEPSANRRREIALRRLDRGIGPRRTAMTHFAYRD